MPPLLKNQQTTLFDPYYDSDKTSAMGEKLLSITSLNPWDQIKEEFLLLTNLPSRPSYHDKVDGIHNSKTMWQSKDKKENIRCVSGKNNWFPTSENWKHILVFFKAARLEGSLNDINDIENLEISSVYVPWDVLLDTFGYDLLNKKNIPHYKEKITSHILAVSQLTWFQLNFIRDGIAHNNNGIIVSYIISIDPIYKKRKCLKLTFNPTFQFALINKLGKRKHVFNSNLAKAISFKSIYSMPQYLFLSNKLSDNYKWIYHNMKSFLTINNATHWLNLSTKRFNEKFKRNFVNIVFPELGKISYYEKKGITYYNNVFEFSYDKSSPISIDTSITVKKLSDSEIRSKIVRQQAEKFKNGQLL